MSSKDGEMLQIKNILFMINLYAFNICDTLKHNGFVIDFIDFIYVLSSIMSLRYKESFCKQ